MIVDTRHGFLLQIFVKIILCQKTSLVFRVLLLACDECSLRKQRYCLSIVELESELVELLNSLMDHFDVLFELGLV